MRPVLWIVLSTLFALSGRVWAQPLVAVDSLPDVEGVQGDAEVFEGAIFGVDVVVEDVANLNGFQFTLVFDPSVVDPLDLADGGFLLDPLVEVDRTLGAVSVSFAEVTSQPVGASGSGVLAALTFEALAVGSSGLDLVESADPTETLILSAPFGTAICGDPGGTACRVSNAVVTVPEPGGLLSFCAAALVVALRRTTSSLEA